MSNSKPSLTPHLGPSDDDLSRQTTAMDRQTEAIRETTDRLCFPAETFIAIKDDSSAINIRLVSISDLQVNDVVLSYNLESSTFEYHPIVAISQRWKFRILKYSSC